VREIGIVALVSAKGTPVQMPSSTTLATIGGAILLIAQMFGLTLPAMNDASLNRTARIDNVDELRRVIVERDEYKADWRKCVEDR